MNGNIKRKIRLGMVGGGQGAFVGAVHRMAARLDGDYELVAGALSSRPDVALASARELGLDPSRSYSDFARMAKEESAREDGIEIVSIVTPNHMHFAPVKAFLQAGIHVICDKPLTSTLEDALELATMTPGNHAKFMITHNYTGYPLVRTARDMVCQGELGKIRVVQVEYPQDWLATPVSNKQADWRTDPECAGAGGSLGDIGTHAYNLLRFVTGLQTSEISADLTAFVPGRRLDDNVHMMLRFEGGARGMLWASQVAPGHENALRLRIFGEKAGLEWRQDLPNRMWFSPLNEPKRLLTRGCSRCNAPGAGARVPPGHPEGYLEAFATLYTEFAEWVRGHGSGALLPTLADGVEGMKFVAAAVASASANGRWTAL